MGYLWDYLTGGNVKVAASSLASLHFYCQSNYLNTYIMRLTSLMQVILPKRNKKTFETINIVSNNNISNYIELVTLDLYINSAPEYTSFYETFNSFNKEIEKYLIKNGIERSYISGDNRYITSDYINTLNSI